MFDLGWTELLVIGVVALIVVGPKDLPMLFRKVGQFVGKAKGMAREFTSAMDKAADESGMKEATSSFKNMASAKDMGLDDLKDSLDPLKDVDADSETAKLAEKRAKQVKDMQDLAKRNHEERLARDAAKAAEAEAAKPAAKKAPAKKAPVKKAPVKKAPAKAAAKPAAKTAAKAAPKTAAKKPAAKTAAPKKAAPKSASKDTA